MPERAFMGLILVVGMTLVFLLAPGRTAGATIVVDDDGGAWADHESIQEAIDSAANGSVIRVYDGLYPEYLRIEKTVEIVGNGTDRTVIDGRGVRIVVRISYDGVNITHLEVTGSEDHRDGFWDAGILVEAANVTIADVLLRDNDEGLLAFESPGLALLDCTFDRNSLPVRISEADGARLLNNTFLRNGEGMDIWHSVGCTLRDNVFDAYGVRLFGGRPECYGSHDIDRSNTVDGRPVVYISGSTGTDIPPDAAQVIVTNRSGVRVGNLTMTNVTHGVQVAFADDTLLSGLTVTNCSKEALRAVWSDRLILDGVNCTGCEDGVQILYCNSTVITDCNMSSNEWYGLDLAYSENVTVLRTVMARNGNGMHLQNMSDSVIRGNDILRNQGDGIQVMSTGDTMILRNRIEHNRGWGLNINPSSEGNFVHMNDFEWNGGLQAQAFDKDGGADWSNGTVGNYWSDYTGSDDDRDGIGDTPYHLDTDTDVVDPHPVMERFRPSALDDPPRAVILSVTPFPATCGGNVTFVAFASDSDGEVTLYVWSSSIDGEFYNGTANSTTTNRLSEGVHTIVLRCMDDEGAWSAPATLVLEVREPSNATNERPHASILLIAPDPARAGENMTFEATGGDDDGVVVRIRWNSSRDGLLYDGPAWSFERNLSSGLHNISLVVQDDDGGWSLPEWLYVAVHPDQTPSNRWPVALIDSIEPDPAVAGRNVTLVGNGTDEDGNVTRYIWISDRDGLLYSSPKGTWTTSMLSPGVHTIQLRVIDDEGAWSNATTVVLTVRPPANVRPEAVIVEINPSPAYNDSAVHFVGGGDDPDGTIVWYFWESNLAGILYDGPNSSFTSDPLPAGDHVITLTVRDDGGSWSDPVTCHLRVRVRSVSEADEGDEDRGILGTVEALLGDPYVLILLTVVIIVIVVWAAAAIRSSRRRREAEEADRRAREASSRPSAPPPEAFMRPPPGAGPRDPRRPEADRDAGGPEVEWAVDPGATGRRTPDPFGRYERRYQRELYSRPEPAVGGRTPPRAQARVPREDVHGPSPSRRAPPHAPPYGHPPPGRPPRQRPAEPPPEPPGFLYEDGGKAYRRYIEPVDLPGVVATPRCSECGEPLEPGARFCPGCGEYFG